MDKLAEIFIKSLNHNKDIQSLLTVLLQNNYFGVAVYQADGTCLYCNDKGASIIGGSKEIIMKNNFYKLQSWKTTSLLEIATKALNTKTTQFTTISTKSSFGKNVSINAQLQYIELNNQPHLILLVEDRSHERYLETRLQEIMDNMPIGLGVTDQAYHVIESNKFLEELIGYSKEELKNTSVLEFTHPEDREKTVQFSSSLYPQKQDLSKYEKRYICRDGSTKWVRVIARSSKVFEGITDYQSFVTVEDITAEKKNELELKRLNELAESQKMQLMSAAKMTALGEMAAGLAHEVNNPLAIISLKLARIKKQLKEKDPMQYSTILTEIEKIEFVVFRIAKIVKGLKSFSRNTENDPKEIYSVTKLVEDSVDLCSNKIEELGIHLTIEENFEGDICCRPIQISQVLVNLISNSIDAIQEFSNRWIKIIIDKREQFLVIRVIDAGLGIDDKILEKIMDPFFTSKEVGKGTGLGLSISKGIIESHNGSIRYEKFKNHTSFVLELPFS